MGRLSLGVCLLMLSAQARSDFTCWTRENLTDVRPNGGALQASNCISSELDEKLMVIVGHESQYYCASSASHNYENLLASRNCDFDAQLLLHRMGYGTTIFFGNATCVGGGTGGGGGDGDGVGMGDAGNGPIIVLENCESTVGIVNKLITNYNQSIIDARVTAIAAIAGVLFSVVAVVIIAKLVQRKRERILRSHREYDVLLSGRSPESKPVAS